MNPENSTTSSPVCQIDPHTVDTCNAICALMFLLTGLLYLTTADWFGAGVWLLLGAACALVVGVPNYWRESWRHPRSLASMTCMALAVALLLFSPPFHHHASLSAPAEKADHSSPGNK